MSPWSSIVLLLLLLPCMVFSSPQSWRELTPESSTSGPAPRLGAVLASTSGLYALHGGCSSSCCYAPLDDLWVLTPAATWVNVSTQLNPPSGRLYHGTSPAASPNSSYIYGGTDVETGCLDELFLLTLSTSGGDGGSPPVATWVPVQAPLPHPIARSGHTQTALGGTDGSFLVLGGEDDGGVKGDAWLFQPSSTSPAQGSWSLVSNFSDSGPGPRVQHSALAFSAPSGGSVSGAPPPLPLILLACGTDANVDDRDDVWLLDMGVTPPQWLLVGARPSNAPASAWPTPRHGHVAWGQTAQAVGQGHTQLSFLLFGGQSGQVPDPSQFLGDTWLFTVTVAEAAGGGMTLVGGLGGFTPVHPSLAPSVRALPGLAAFQSSTVLVGGFAGYNGSLDDRLLNDAWVYTSPSSSALPPSPAAGVPPTPPRSVSRGPRNAHSTTTDCKAGLCGGMANYPVAPGMKFYATFNVPGLPLNKSAIEHDVTFFIYQNVFFDGGPGQCANCKMDQFVNQLMIGQPLYGSTGPPDYNPLWMPVETWIFAAQYFMEIYPNGTAKAAAGQWYNCSEGDVLWTSYELSEDWVWTLGMGVVGDPSRTSTLVVDKPFMGLLPETTSWEEPAYSVAHFNGCWELYGVAPYGGTHYPSSSSVFDMRTSLGGQHPTPFPWQTEWSNIEYATCPGHPNGYFSEIHNETQQDVAWIISF